ncbi:nuclear transport factor 2 family protein [Aquirufa salirivi]|uniref:Nuclear transport factor 2 family protein n=1 Tax=Aquirufa salirivi TaxID=3104729 RepID=A0ABW8RY19_9BACT
MKSTILTFVFALFFIQMGVAQQSSEEQTLIKLSNDKWQWMSDKDVTKLDALFDAKSKFVHMSGTWKKEEELDIIKTGRIWYKKATVKDTAVELFGNTAIVWNRITLDAVVREQVAVTEFTVTEVYQKNGQGWKLLALTFSSVRDTHQIKQ